MSARRKGVATSEGIGGSDEILQPAGGDMTDRREAHVLLDPCGFPNVVVSATCTTNRSMVACSSAVRCT